MSYKIKVYNPDCSAWFEIAEFSFCPIESIVDSVVRAYVDYSLSWVARVRVYFGRKIVRDYEI